MNTLNLAKKLANAVTVEERKPGRFEATASIQTGMETSSHTDCARVISYNYDTQTVEVLLDWISVDPETVRVAEKLVSERLECANYGDE